MYHTWHLNETLLVTSTILATGPSTTGTNGNIATFADELGYTNAGSSDNTYLSVTSSAANSEFPTFTLREVNYSADKTQQIGVFWQGQSTNTATDVRVQVFKFAGSNSGWYDLGTGTPPGANTNFSISATATASFPVPGSAMSDYYGTDPTGGISGTSVAIVRVYQGAGAGETLRTDQLSVTFAAPPVAGPSNSAILTQRAFILENDTGNTVDTNTQRGTGIAYPVEQGERFIVRFQVDNTGVGATTAQFTVQYDHNDGIWNSVTSGEISPQLGISGSNGDALTTNKAGSCQGGTSFVNGAWQEGTATTGSFTLTNGNCTEFGFIFSTATAVPRTTYNFRLVNGTNGNQDECQ